MVTKRCNSLKVLSSDQSANQSANLLIKQVERLLDGIEEAAIRLL